jgi:transcriptional regulator with XRE-family HTH domain
MAGGDDLLMDGRERRRALGRFLRERREKIAPGDVGLPPAGRRRTPGLRREEVASLAGISTTYYTKIEQGRVDVSERALSAIAGALQLSHTQREYALALSLGRPVEGPREIGDDVSPALRLFMELQEPYPVHILNRRWDIVAWNQASCAAIVDLDPLPPQARNLLMLIFLMPPAREDIVEWEKQARRIVAEFRADYGRYHNDPAFAEMIALLRDKSPEFRQWWAESSDVGSPADTEMHFNHPTAGRLRLMRTAFTSHDYPGMRIILFLPQDKETEEKLQALYVGRMAQRDEAGVSPRNRIF